MTEEQTKKNVTFPKEEKLCSEKAIDRLFSEGDSFIAYPLRVVYCLYPQDDDANRQYPSVLISVSKRKFKRAVKRNRVKRLVREVYRHNKDLFKELLIDKNKRIDIAFIYLKDELPIYTDIEKSMTKVLDQLKNRIGDS